MSITPQEISDKAFSRTFRGYNQEEVDLFLDKIYFELEEMIRYKDETELYIKKLEERLSYYTNDIPNRIINCFWFLVVCYCSLRNIIRIIGKTFF